jgi:capsular exopolysaccharide synthesis family protein
VSTSDPPNPSPTADDGGARFDPREYLRTLSRYKWVTLTIAVLVTTGVTAWTLRQPKIYEATCSLEYDGAPVSPLGSEIDTPGSVSPTFFTSREFLETQNRILGSRAVAERVVRRLSLNTSPAFLDVNPADFRPLSVEAAAEELQKRVTIEPVRATRLVHVRVRDKSPERARLIANSIADAYIEKKMEDRLSTTVSALEWLSTQLDSLRGRLEESELALHRFKEQNNILAVSMEDRRNLVAAEIEKLSSALTDARRRQIELSARLAQLRRAAANPALDARSAAIDSNPTVASLRQAIREKTAERDTLGVRYGDSHPTMVALRQSIESMQEQLRREIDGLVRSAEADVAEARAVEAGIRQALEAANRAGLELNLREIEYGRLSREAENTSKLYGIVLSRTTETDLTRMLRVANARVVDRALAPRVPVSPRVAVNVSFGSLAGLFLGLGAAVALSRLDRRIKSLADVEALGLPVLGILPQFSPAAKPARVKGRRSAADEARRYLTVHHEPRSAAAECCRTVRTNLAFMSAEAPARSLVVTSASPSEGKTTVAVSLAIAMAQSGKRVLLVDTDLRRPKVHKAFRLPLGQGVTAVLVGDCALEDVVQRTEVANLDVVTCGAIPPNPSELLHTSRFSALVAEALAEYDRVLFDSPPLGAVVDAAVVATQAQGVIIVARSEYTTRDALASVLRQLRDVKAMVRGAVVNCVDLSASRYGYGNYYYYSREGYYASPAASGDDGPPAERDALA